MDPTQWGAPFEIVVAALFCIVLMRANATYWIGRGLAAGARRTRLASAMESPRYGQVVERLNTWGPVAVTLSFLTIGVQTLVNLAAGATRMPLWRYLPAATLGCVMWAFLYATAGFVGFDALARLWARSPILAVSLGAVAIGGIVWFVVAQVRRHTRPDAAP